MNGKFPLNDKTLEEVQREKSREKSRAFRARTKETRNKRPKDQTPFGYAEFRNNIPRYD